MTLSDKLTPSSFIVTLPLSTAKFCSLKLAIPLFDVEASSPAIVIVALLTLVSIPSPPAIVKAALPDDAESWLESSAVILTSVISPDKSLFIVSVDPVALVETLVPPSIVKVTAPVSPFIVPLSDTKETDSISPLPLLTVAFTILLLESKPRLPPEAMVSVDISSK